MPSERVNGTRINLEAQSDDELMQILDNTVERLYRAEQDVERVLAHAQRRGLVPDESELGDGQMEIPYEDVV